jgi:hypothetical protein
MGTNEKPRQQPAEDDIEDLLELDYPVHRPRIDPDERDEFEEWRRERGGRGRKRRRSRENERSRRDVEDL